MKKNFLYLFLMLLIFSSSAQNHKDTKADDIDLHRIIPSDFDVFWHNMDACGNLNLNNAYTYMDTFRVYYRQPFSQNLLGVYFLGHIKSVDSIVSTSPFDVSTHDSLVYLYVLFAITNRYYSPYNKDTYFSPIYSDVENDIQNGYSLFSKLLHDTVAEPPRLEKICILCTKEEMEKIYADEKKLLLLRMDEGFEYDSNSTFFSSQPFIDNYNTNLLLSKQQKTQYKILRYRMLYYDMYKKEVPDFE